jgi:uncharacterized protein YeaO (DUF488 family)
MTYSIRVKRVYDAASPTDGYRILVDRLWPRGLTHDRAAIDEWMKEIAPSHDLRHWFAHDSNKWTAFREHYQIELDTDAGRALINTIREKAQSQDVTLLFSAKNEEENNAVVLKHILETKR